MVTLEYIPALIEEACQFKGVILIYKLLRFPATNFFKWVGKIFALTTR